MRLSVDQALLSHGSICYNKLHTDRVSKGILYSFEDQFQVFSKIASASVPKRRNKFTSNKVVVHPVSFRI